MGSSNGTYCYTLLHTATYTYLDGLLERYILLVVGQRVGPRTEHSHTGRVEEDGEDGEVEDGLLKEHPDDLAAGVPEIGVYRKTERNRFTIGTHTYTHTHVC